MERKFSPFMTGILVLMVLFHGCSSLQKEPVTKQYFDLAPRLPAPIKGSLCQGETLMVKAFSINSAFDSHSFVYKVGENEYATDYYTEFISYPSKLITEKISGALFGSLYFRPALTDDKKDVAYRLSGTITRLSGDYTDKKNPKASMELMLILEKKTGSAFTPVLSNTYAVDEPIPDRNPSSLVSGWNAGLSEILGRFMAEIDRLPTS
ncbi:MAG: hypothetical protein M0T82_01165 [Desulfobacteraceae bacterium]|nr:hypothetical protein [Desulfobacteraceae bacterium]